MISKVFHRKTHQSYARRAKNDEMVKHITDRFSYVDDKKADMVSKNETSRIQMQQD